MLSIVKINTQDYASQGEFAKYCQMIHDVSVFLDKYSIPEEVWPKNEYKDKPADFDFSKVWFGQVVSGEFMADDSKVVRMLRECEQKRFTLTIVNQYDAEVADNKEQKGILSTMHDILEKMKNTEFIRGMSFNEKCEVHVGGFALLSIDSVMLCEDCCTDRLQGHLDEGWRILSVNVQPDQRRPDYILGRSVPPSDKAKYSNAERG